MSDPKMTARAIIARSHDALRCVCSDSMMMSSSDMARALVLEAMSDLDELSARVHMLALGKLARDVAHALRFGKRGHVKRAALEALRSLRSLEHQLNLNDDKLFAEMVKRGEDWAAARADQSDLAALAKREVAR